MADSRCVHVDIRCVWADCIYIYIHRVDLITRTWAVSLKHQYLRFIISHSSQHITGFHCDNCFVCLEAVSFCSRQCACFVTANKGFLARMAICLSRVPDEFFHFKHSKCFRGHTGKENESKTQTYQAENAKKRCVK